MTLDGLKVVEILQIGVIGLGFLLAFLAYHLLTKEQRQDNPRPIIIRSIHVFMTFSVVLCLIGVLSQQIQGLFKAGDLTAPSPQEGNSNHQELLDELAIANLNVEELGSELQRLENKNIELVEENKSIKKLQKEKMTLTNSLKDSKGKTDVLEKRLRSQASEITKLDTKTGALGKQLTKCSTEKEKAAEDLSNKLAKTKNDCLITPQTKISTDTFPIKAFWLGNKVVSRFADGKVLIVCNFYQNTLSVTSGSDRQTFKPLEPGSRFEFPYSNTIYFIDILEKNNFTEQILVAIVPAQ